MWKRYLAEYVAAKRHYQEARHIMLRAERTFLRLADRHGVEEARAYAIAGVGLADERSVRACREMIEAFGRLGSAVRCESTAVRLLCHGAAMYSYEPPRAANDKARA